MKLSVVIPAHNEESSIGPTLLGLAAALADEGIDYELLVSDDASTDQTAEVVQELARANERVRYHRLLEEGYDCAFGSRFMRGSIIRDYPPFKLVLNRMVNFGIRMLFRHGYNDTTNAFKAYRREVIETIQPLLSNHFNLTVELPLKAVVRGHSYGIVPISWTNRTAGSSKLGLKEMGSQYLFIILYVFLEDHLSRGDYRPSNHKRNRGARVGRARERA